jgi:hypothetical protein
MMITKYLNKINDKRPWVKEGYIGMFVFFPVLLEDEFEKYLAQSFDALKEVLSDEDDTIRKLGLKVVRILIKKFAVRNMKLIVASVKDGLFSSQRP